MHNVSGHTTSGLLPPTYAWQPRRLCQRAEPHQELLLPDAHGVQRGLRDVLDAFPSREDVHPQSGVPTLRLRTDPAASVPVVDQP